MGKILKVLIVDDDRSFANVFAAKLKENNWQTTCAYGGRHALRVLGPSFDAVVLDQEMPGLHGVETLKEIRRRYELDGVCVIMLTAFANVARAVESIRLGAYRYLEKPFDPEILQTTVMAGVARQKLIARRRELLAAREMNTFLDQASLILYKALDSAALCVGYLDSDGAIQRLQFGNDRLTMDELASLNSEGQRMFVRKILKTRYPVFAGDTEVRFLDPLIPDAKCLLAVPIRAEERVVGIIDMETTREGGFDRGWEDVLSYLSDLAGMTIERLEGQLEATRLAMEDLRLNIRELSHRILTPVDIIAKHSNMMLTKDLAQVRRTALPRELRHSLEGRARTISESASEISVVCDQLSKEAAQTQAPHIRAVSLSTLVQSCLAAYADVFAGHNITLAVIQENEEVSARADPEALKYALQCLLQNAIEAIEEARAKRHAGAESVEGRGRRKRSADCITVTVGVELNNGMARISIGDTGNGVPKRYQQRLFVALFSTKKRPSPSGVGLFSVYRSMKLQGGSVELTHSTDRGATFTLRIPLA